MENELAETFDIIVFGTGFTESVVAAASARVGKKVLHIDRNEFYGGEWASFSLASIEDWARKISGENKVSKEADCAPPVSGLAAGEKASPLLCCSDDLYWGVKFQWHMKAEDVDSEGSDVTESPKGRTIDAAKVEEDEKKQKKILRSELEKANSKFNIDLVPKIIFSRGALVDLLISSNVSRYVEFKCITRVLTWVDGDDDEVATPSSSSGKGHLAEVPCSRSSVFTSSILNLVEKRLLMKFLEFAFAYEQHKDDWADFEEKTFREFLASRSLTPKLVHFITSAIGMVEKEVGCAEGLKKTSLFLNSLGRYGPMPFLFPLYGSGEIPQAFCRLCAVFEGVYILRRSVEHLVVDSEGTFRGLISQQQRFRGNHLVMSSAFAPKAVAEQMRKGPSLSRGIFLTDQSILSEEKEHVTLLRMPASCDKHSSVIVAEMGSGCGICPKGTYLVHLTCNGENAQSDLEATVRRLFNADESEESKPNILFSLYFNQRNCDPERIDSKDLPLSTYLCSSPNSSLDYEEAISQARTVFSKVFPDEEFLPRAPDHNEISFEVAEEASAQENGAVQDDGPCSEKNQAAVVDDLEEQEEDENHALTGR